MTGFLSFEFCQLGIEDRHKFFHSKVCAMADIHSGSIP